ncbi:amidohydrolase family protein [Candidatus Latescibacterota bacterium]
MSTDTGRSLTRLRQRLRPPCPVLDAHVHPLDCFGPYTVSSVREDVAGLRATAERAGVSRICVFSLHSECPREPTPDQIREANDYVLRMRDEAPDFVLPFCYVSPAFPDEAVAEIDRCVVGERMVAVKLWVARRATDPGLDPIARRAVDLGVPILQHAWIKTTGNLEGESTPLDVADLARRHPEVRIIMAHLNGCNPRGIEAVRPYPNVVVDTAGGDPEAGIVRHALKRLGPERVVYGSDAPIRHFGVSLAKAMGEGLARDEQVEVLWNNAVRLLPEWAGLEPVK